MVTVAIIGILLSVAVPLYDREVLKGRFEEAKVTLQSIMLAQERYKIEVGKYYTVTTGTISNEDMISNNLKVDLTQSNNFLYQIVATTDTKSYHIKAILRNSSWDNVCTTNDANDVCKQKTTIDREEWVTSYTTSLNNHFIEVTYPTLYTQNGTTVLNVENGINYTNINKGD